jgi:hypothetical protein
MLENFKLKRYLFNSLSKTILEHIINKKDNETNMKLIITFTGIGLV